MNQKVKMKYDSWDYARQRLDGTVVRLNNEPVYLSHIDNWVFSIRTLSTGEKTEKDIRKIPLDLEPVPLGYINTGNHSYYLTRQPVRRWKQGLSYEALRIIKSDTDAKRGLPNVGRIITSRELARCVLNEYPTIKQAYFNVRYRGYSSSAFSRIFSINHTRTGLVIVYKGRTVGSIDDKGINLYPKFNFLKEVLEESVK